MVIPDAAVHAGDFVDEPERANECDVRAIGLGQESAATPSVADCASGGEEPRAGVLAAIGLTARSAQTTSACTASACEKSASAGTPISSRPALSLRIRRVMVWMPSPLPTVTRFWMRKPASCRA